MAITQPLLPLEQFYWREKRHPDRRYLIQPQAGGQVEELTWGQVGEQARRAAAWLRQLELAPGSRIAIISKNCAHWIVADLAIWMAGHVSVPLYPNLTAESVRQILEHSESAVALIGKLDDWPAMAPGVPEGVRTVGLPLRPTGRFDHLWSDLQACTPITDNPAPQACRLATIIYTSGTTGVPKGVMHSFGNFGFTGRQAVALFGVQEGDRGLSYLPLCTWPNVSSSRWCRSTGGRRCISPRAWIPSFTISAVPGPPCSSPCHASGPSSSTAYSRACRRAGWMSS